MAGGWFFLTVNEAFTLGNKDFRLPGIGSYMQRGKNAIFVFRVDDICVAHLGDLGHIPTPDQLKMMGKIDILLVPIAGGYFTVTATEAREVTKLVNPKIAIPMVDVPSQIGRND